MSTTSRFLLADADRSYFDHWWNRYGPWVEPPNQRRGGESGVQIIRQQDSSRKALYCKRQTGHLYRSLRYPFGRPTILREHQAYQALSRIGIGVPTVSFCGARRQLGQWQALLVTEELKDYFSLETWYSDTSLSAVARERILELVATVLARMHSYNWQHGCCYAKHIFIRLSNRDAEDPDADIAFLDLEKSRRRWRSQQASQHDMRQLARHRGKMPDADWEVLMRIYNHTLKQL